MRKYRQKAAYGFLAGALFFSLYTAVARNA